MVQVIWLPGTLATLNDIRQYIRQFDSRAADRIVDRLRIAGESLAVYPNRGRAAGRYRELATVPPYVLRCRVTEDVVYIIRVKHGRQRR